MGGAEGKVAFIDTEGTFRPERHSFHTLGILTSILIADS